VFALLFGGHSSGSDEIEFTNRAEIESNVSDNGTVTLAWSSSEGGDLTLQQSSSRGFDQPVTRYRGSDRSSVINGLAEGTHFFRVGRVETGTWSPPLEVKVQFFPGDRLVLLLLLGAMVVVSTIVAIIGGWAKTKGEEGGSE